MDKLFDNLFGGILILLVVLMVWYQYYGIVLYGQMNYNSCVNNAISHNYTESDIKNICRNN